MTDISEFEFIRMRQKNLMPLYMKEFHKELTNRPRPSVENMLKKDYISSWFGIFSPNDALKSEDSIKRFLKYNVLQLQKAFEWVINHFAELDLGGNMKWYEVTEATLKHIGNSTWSPQTEKEIIAAYISDTRWFDY